MGTLTRPRDDNCGLEVPAVSMYVTEEAILASVAPLCRRHAIGFMRPRAPAATSTETEEKEAERGALGAGWMDGWSGSDRPGPWCRASGPRDCGALWASWWTRALFGTCSDSEPPAGALLKVASARRKKNKSRVKDRVLRLLRGDLVTLETPPSSLRPSTLCQSPVSPDRHVLQAHTGTGSSSD